MIETIQIVSLKIMYVTSDIDSKKEVTVKNWIIQFQKYYVGISKISIFSTMLTMLRVSSFNCKCYLLKINNIRYVLNINTNIKSIRFGSF